LDSRGKCDKKESGELQTDGKRRETRNRGDERDENGDGRDRKEDGKKSKHDLPRGGEEPSGIRREISSRESAGKDEREKKEIEEEPKNQRGGM
jgi:hypothetical protein